MKESAFDANREKDLLANSHEDIMRNQNKFLFEDLQQAEGALRSSLNNELYQIAQKE